MKLLVCNRSRFFASGMIGLVQQQQRCFRASQILFSRQQNHYQVLGLKVSCTDKDIKMAYFKLAKKYHPDVNPEPGAKEKFQKATQAYEVLSDDTKRDTYDQQMGFGGQSQKFNDFHSASQAARQRAKDSGVYSDDEYESVKTDKRTKPFRGREQYTHASDTSHSQKFWQDTEAGKDTQKEEFAKQVWDEFDEFFQFNDQTHATRDDTKGADLKADIEVDFLDAIKGYHTKLELNKRVMCHVCKGTKAKQGSHPRKCFECGGRGSVIGNYGIRKKCKKCNGAGCTVRVPCDNCEGLGVERSTVKEDLDLPPGVSNGQKIKIKGLGHASDVFQGIPGDILLTVSVKPHAIFRREGQNIYSEVPLSLTDALLGNKITIDTIDGKLNIEVSAGVNDGDELVLKHKGVPLFENPDNYDEDVLRGDHIIHFNVRIPKELTQKQKELLKQYQEHEFKNKEKYYEQVKQEHIDREKLKIKQQEEQQQKQQSSTKTSHSQSQKSSSTKKQKVDKGGLFGKIKDIFQ